MEVEIQRYLLQVNLDASFILFEPLGNHASLSKLLGSLRGIKPV